VSDLYWHLGPRVKRRPGPKVRLLADDAFPWEAWRRRLTTCQIHVVRFEIVEDRRIVTVQARFADGSVVSVAGPSSLREAFEEIQRQTAGPVSRRATG
jgi:hypothetical protein